MRDHRAVISALKRLSKTSLVKTDTSAFNRLLDKESDRAVIIMMASLVEDALKDRFEKEMRPLNKREQEELFGFKAPLGSFADRINVAWALKYVGDQVRENLLLVKEMRNQAAHSQQRVNFATKLIVDAMNDLLPIPPRPKNAIQRRGCYIAVCNILAMVIDNPKADQAKAHYLFNVAVPHTSRRRP